MNDTSDPYTYPGTDVLRNLFDIQDDQQLREAEYEHTRQRLSEQLPDLSLTPDGYRSLHHHIFQDVFSWAGSLRTVNLSKDDSLFALPQYLAPGLEKRFEEMRSDLRLMSQNADTFAEAVAEHINELNALHPFREGNGRAQRALIEWLAQRAGFTFQQSHIDGREWNEASRIGFQTKNYGPMKRVLRKALAR